MAIVEIIAMDLKLITRLNESGQSTFRPFKCPHLNRREQLSDVLPQLMIKLVEPNISFLNYHNNNCFT